MTLKDAIEKDILVLDGAMGTMIQRKGLSGNSEQLNLTHPEIIAEIHREYMEAGASVITANTFSANRISQAEYGLEGSAREMAYAGARIARDVADEYMYIFNSRRGLCSAQGEAGGQRPQTGGIYVTGSVGPTSKSLTLAPDITDPSLRPYSFDEMAAAYKEQIEALIDGGVDAIQLETFFDALNAKAALYALSVINEERGFAEPFPAIVSVSVSDRSGRTLTGQTIEAFYNSVRHYPLTAFGINCSLGAEDMISLVKDISGFCECPVICYPNAGLPNELGGYDETPEQMAAHVAKMAGAVNIIGGCCGTTPDHIKAVADMIGGCGPHTLLEKSSFLKVSGLDAVDIDLETRNFTNVGERTNVAGSRKFARLIASGDYESALQIAAGQIENGAEIIDINMDDAMLDSTAEMEKFVRWTQNDPAVAKAALMIDSSHWETILAGLKNAQGKCIVNSISLKDGEAQFVEKAREINRLGAAVVVMAFDEEGQATTYERKIQIAERAYKLLVDNGVPASDIIFDVNILSVGTGIAEHSRYAVDYIEAVRWIKTNLPGVRTSGGVSNLSFAFRGNNPVREAMHSVFLYHAIRAGLDMAIMNPGMVQVYDEIEPELRRCVEDVIFDSDEGATERLIAKAQEIMEAATAAKQAGAAAGAGTGSSADVLVGTPEERLSEALVKGRTAGLAEDVLAGLEKLGSAVAVIEGPLMAGMEKVGELFGAGKMFLPQVVKSAKVMRDAVAVLEPYMGHTADAGIEIPAETSSAAAPVKPSRPVIINATVKGDVHDIGKNITGIVLSCNGFEVIDLGVMVDNETIINAAVEHGAVIIGASGLITPSLFQMEELCRELSSRGLSIPLFIGGATTSALHTAVKLAPLYDHVFYSPDASASAVMAKKLMMDRDKFEAEEHQKQQDLRDLHERKGRTEAKKTLSPFDADDYLKGCPFETRPTFAVPAQELKEFFDWRMFLAVWGVKYGSELPDDPEIGKILEEGRRVLDAFDGEILVSMRFFEAYSEGDSVVVDEGLRIPMLRQEGCLSLCDFVPPAEYGFKSPLGIFAVSVVDGKTGSKGKTAGPGRAEIPLIGVVDDSLRGLRGSAFRRKAIEGHPLEYGGMMSRAVRVTLAEAASAWIDARLGERMAVVSECACAGESATGLVASGPVDDEYKIIKPAIGYAACPDHSLKRDVLALLPDSERLGIALTDSCAMIPDASVCGFILAHKKAAYPEVRGITSDQYNRYAALRGFDEETARKFLGHLL